MNHETETADASTAELTRRNIEITGQFLQEILADPSLLDAIPEGATLVTLPYDDPALGLRNLALASRVASNGTRVELRRSGVSKEMGEQEGHGADAGVDIQPWLAAHWDESATMAMQKDGRTAAVALLFYGNEGRESHRLPTSARTSLLVDSTTDEIVGYEVPAAWVAQLMRGRAALPGAVDDPSALSSYTAEAYACFTEDLAREAA